MGALMVTLCISYLSPASISLDNNLYAGMFVATFTLVEAGIATWLSTREIVREIVLLISHLQQNVENQSESPPSWHRLESLLVEFGNKVRTTEHSLLVARCIACVHRMKAHLTHAAIEPEDIQDLTRLSRKLS